MRVTLQFYSEGGLWFEIRKVTQVPRIGEAVHFDGVDGVVAGVTWNYAVARHLDADGNVGEPDVIRVDVE